MTAPTCRVSQYRVPHTCLVCASDGFYECFCLVSTMWWNAGISVSILEWDAILVMVIVHMLASLYHFIIDCVYSKLRQVLVLS